MKKFRVTRTISVDPISVSVEVEAESCEQAVALVEDHPKFMELDEVDLQDALTFQEEAEEVSENSSE